MRSGDYGCQTETTAGALDAYFAWTLINLRPGRGGPGRLFRLDAYQLRGLLAGSWTLTLWTTIFGHLFAEKTLEKRRLGSLRHFGAPPPRGELIGKARIFGHLFAEKIAEKCRLSSLRHFGAPPPVVS